MAQWVKRVHRSSAFAVYSSMALLAEALWLAARGLTPYHAALMASTVLPVFVAGIASSYAASGIMRSPRSNTLAMLLVAMTYLLTVTGLGIGLATLLYKLPPSPLLATVYAAYALALWLAALNTPPGSAKLSIAGLAYAFTLSAIYLLLPRWGRGFFEDYLGLVYGVAVTSIYAVTIHSFPSTYGDRPRAGLVYALYASQGASILIYAWRPWLGALALSATMLLYIPAAKLDKITVFLEKTRAMKRGPARSSHMYFLIGHGFVIAYIFLVAATGLMYSSSATTHWLLYLYIHMTTIGFITQHILIHAPMMIPIILGIPTARRYTALNYILLFLAAISFPLSEDTALILLLLALTATAMIAWPRRWPKKIPPGL